MKTDQQKSIMILVEWFQNEELNYDEQSLVLSNSHTLPVVHA